MTDSRELLRRTAELAADYVESLGERPVFPDVTPEQLREALGGPLPEEPLPPGQVVEELAAAAEPGVVALGSGRYFGFVIGGALPAALVADWLTSAWDQNAGLYVGGPSASVVEQVTREWLVDLLGLPADSSIGFVTGTQMAHVTGLAAARLHVLDAVGWDVGAQGLTGAPQVQVLVGEKRHVTVDRALRLLGLGAPTVVAADSQGRLAPEALIETLGEGLPERADLHAALVVRCNRGRRTEAEQPQRPVDGHVPLLADDHADGRRPGEAVAVHIPADPVEHVEARRGKPRHVRHLGARDEADGRLAGQPEQLDEPFPGHLLDHRRRRAAGVEAGVLVPGGGEPVGRQGRGNGAADHEAEVAAASRRDDTRLGRLCELCNHLVGVQRLLGHRSAERLA